jgi:hypothetical protein
MRARVDPTAAGEVGHLGAPQRSCSGRPARRSRSAHGRLASCARPSSSTRTSASCVRPSPRARRPSGLDKRPPKLTLRLGDNKSSGVLNAPCDKAQGVRDDNGESSHGGAVLAAPRNGKGDARSSRDDRCAARRRRLSRRDPLARAARDRHLSGSRKRRAQLRRPRVGRGAAGRREFDAVVAAGMKP